LIEYKAGLLLVCALTAFGQQSASLPAGAQVVDRYIQALGGRQALDGVSSRAAVGSLHSPTSGAWGRYMELYQRPNRLLRAFHVPGYGVVQICFDGSAAWMETPEYGVEDLTGKRLSEARRDAEFEDALKLTEIYSALAVRRRTKIEGREAFEVEAQCPDGDRETLYFDTVGGLLLCRESPETARDGSTRLVRTYYEDYSDVGGVKTAGTLRYVREDLIRVMRRNVTNNPPVDGSRFKKP